MSVLRRTSRRSVLASCVGVLSVLAGCSSRSPTSPSDNTTDGTPTSRGADLDLREANVVDVEITSDGEGAYRFDVTLYHDDDGEDGYADWWQVERLDGTRLGRRTLLHAHSTAPFTRSETIEIPAGVACVVVRGHDQRHGYGGQAAVVSLPDGIAQFVQQGGDSRPLTETDCPE